MSALVIALILALIILSMSGVGTTAILSLIGMAICAICLFRKEAQIDWWIFIPLAVYVAMNFVSSWVNHENPLFGYGRLHIIYLSLYAAICCLRDQEMRFLRTLVVAWAALAACLSVFGFVYQSFTTTTTRLAFIVGTPNGLAIFLVLSWFALQSCRIDSDEKHPNKLFKIVSRFEPVILIAIAMTLSIGSLLALFVGLIVLFVSRARATRSANETFRFAVSQLARAFLCVLIGFLMYMAGERAEAPFLCLVILLYIVVMVILWDRFIKFANNSTKFSLVISLIGLLSIPFAIFMRPNAFATFGERIAMMGNGLSYLGEDPLVGIGALTWRSLNLQDPDLYFNTNHIHNAFIHVGVEFGWIAMIALIVIAVRVFVKHYKEAQHAEDGAFLFHLLTDTGFFYVGVVGTFILTAGGSTTPGKTISNVATKLLFGSLCIVHFLILWNYLAMF